MQLDLVLNPYSDPSCRDCLPIPFLFLVFRFLSAMPLWIYLIFPLNLYGLFSASVCLIP